MSEERTAEVQINFSQTVPASSGVMTTQSYFSAGKLTQIIFHFPPGCSGLVDVALYKDGRQFYPLTGYLALDNATPVCYVDADYYAKEPLTLEVRNRDSMNAHSPTCTVTVRFKRPSWSE